MMRSPRPRLAALLLPLLLLAGCTPDDTSPTFAVPAGQYSRAFEASESALRDYRFALARIDARAGVISTHPKRTSGLATPWDVEQSTLGQEFEDLASNHSRRVRVTFEPASPPNAGDSATALDRAPLVGRVEVILIRAYARDWRPSSASILDSSFAYDPTLSAKGQSATYEAPLTRDERLAARIAATIRTRLARDETSPAPARPPQE